MITTNGSANQISTFDLMKMNRCFVVYETFCAIQTKQPEHVKRRHYLRKSLYNARKMIGVVCVC